MDIVEERLSKLKADMKNMDPYEYEKAMGIILDFGTCCTCSMGSDSLQRLLFRLDVRLEEFYANS